MSAVVDADIEVALEMFANRFELGRFLYSLFDNAPIIGLDNDRGIWAWLAAFYFENLCPPGISPGDRARWIPDVGNFRKYYRHLLVGPYQIYRAHHTRPEITLALLANAPHEPGDVAEQLTARQELVTNERVMEVATKLYVNPITNQLKRGAAARDNGSARRLAAFLNQLDLTWDLYSLNPDQLLDLLPSEFDRFKP